jgi:acyl-CoA thioesterase FadM
MFPYIKLIATLFKARYRPELNLNEKSVLHCRAGITDIDVFIELNNARHLTYMELGRWDYAQRVGWLALMKKNKWAVAVGGASVRYRRRIGFLQKFTLTTQLICHDGRWFYFLQETHVKGKICSSALIKLATTSKQGLVPATEVLAMYDKPSPDFDVPEWVNAWIDAESQRPWPQ